MPKYFGTDGLRGKAGFLLTPYLALKIGYFLGLKALNKKILIGKDPRNSSDMLEMGLVCGILSSGCNAYLLGTTTTPSISYLLKENDYDYGVMISASHNSYVDNGIKIFDEKGFKIQETFEEEIESFIDIYKNINSETSVYFGQYFIIENDKEKYLDFITSKISLGSTKLNLILDCSNGSTSKMAPRLMTKLNVKFRSIANSPNGININENCGSTNIKNLLNNIKENEIGFAYDGDGDRIIAIINNKVFDGDAIIYLLASYLKSQGKLTNNKVVLTVMSNLGIIEALEKIGIQISISPVGDKNVQAIMKKENLSLGGEQSGHIILGDYLMTGDGLIVSALLIEAISIIPNIINTIDEVEYYYQILENIKINNKDKYLNDNILLKMIKSDNDFLDRYGRVFIRASGTENKIRILVESKQENIAKNLLDKYLQYFHSNYY